MRLASGERATADPPSIPLACHAVHSIKPGSRLCCHLHSFRVTMHLPRVGRLAFSIHDPHQPGVATVALSAGGGVVGTLLARRPVVSRSAARRSICRHAAPMGFIASSWAAQLGRPRPGMVFPLRWESTRGRCGTAQGQRGERASDGALSGGDGAESPAGDQWPRPRTEPRRAAVFIFCRRRLYG